VGRSGAADARGADAIGGGLRGAPADHLGDALHVGVLQSEVLCDDESARAGLVGDVVGLVPGEGQEAVRSYVQILRRELPREL
jgi:hypothetical protein